MDYVKPERFSLKQHPQYSEKWVQELIANDPEIIGLGDVYVKDKERVQPQAGRIDLVLQETDGKQRYEVEIQLGATDETHIIRTIEYYDLERKRYPQYEHCAVLIAEDITSRFLNVISLFNGTLPLIAIQMQAFEIGGQKTVIFTKVMDKLVRGLVDEDEEASAAPADRAYWEKRGSKDTVQLAEDVLKIAREFDKSLELKFNKPYVGVTKDKQAFNFARFFPLKTALMTTIRLDQTSEIDAVIENLGVETLPYKDGLYRVYLGHDDITQHRDTLKELLEAAYKARAS